MSLYEQIKELSEKRESILQQLAHPGPGIQTLSDKRRLRIRLFAAETEILNNLPSVLSALKGQECLEQVKAAVLFELDDKISVWRTLPKKELTGTDMVSYLETYRENIVKAWLPTPPEGVSL